MGLWLIKIRYKYANIILFFQEIHSIWRVIGNGRTRNHIKGIFSKRKGKLPDDWSNIKQKIREEIGQFLYKETKRRPMVLPVVIEV